MNRTLLPPATSQKLPAPGAASWFQRQAFACPPERPVPETAHSCFAPMHYESGYAYPLIIWLHGSASNEEELRQVMPLVSTRNYVAIAPRGTRQTSGAKNAFSWSDSSDDIAAAHQRVEQCIALAKAQFNIHPDRIFIAGHSRGGTMAYRLGLQFPELFAGAISLGGNVPRGSHLLKNINRARTMPLLLSVSPTAEKYPTEQVMDDLKFLHYAGLSLSLRLYPAEDELTTVMFSDFDQWVMEQFCPTSAATAS